MTEKLYENDSFLLGGKCRVESCKKTDGGFAVKTDVTVFFPEGGGQPGDREKSERRMSSTPSLTAAR